MREYKEAGNSNAYDIHAKPFNLRSKAFETKEKQRSTNKRYFYAWCSEKRCRFKKNSFYTQHQSHYIYLEASVNTQTYICAHTIYCQWHKQYTYIDSNTFKDPPVYLIVCLFHVPLSKALYTQQK